MAVNPCPKTSSGSFSFLTFRIFIFKLYRVSLLVSTDDYLMVLSAYLISPMRCGKTFLWTAHDFITRGIGLGFNLRMLVFSLSLAFDRCSVLFFLFLVPFICHLLGLELLSYPFLSSRPNDGYTLHEFLLFNLILCGSSRI